MKKLAVIILVLLVTVVSVAATPAPTPTPRVVQLISGTLSYSRNSVCMISDFVALPVMDNVYLVGKGFPTQGQFRGCQINASGSYISLEGCKVFQVTSFRITCGSSTTKPSITAPTH